MRPRKELIEQSTPQRFRSPLRSRSNENNAGTGTDLNTFTALSPVNPLSLSAAEDSKFVEVHSDFSQRYTQIFENNGNQLLSVIPSQSLPEGVLQRQCSLVKKSLKARLELLDDNLESQVVNFSIHSANQFIGMGKKHDDPNENRSLRMLFDGVFDSARIHSDYQNFNQINSTKFAKIYSARHVKSGRTVCLKCSSHSRHGDRLSKEELLKEIQALSVVRHPNVVKYMDSWLESGMLVVLEEYCFGGSLFQFMFPKREGVQNFSYHDTGINGRSEELDFAERTLKPSVLKRLFVDVIKALHYLHIKTDMVHGDVKPSNIMIQIPSLAFDSYSVEESVITESVRNTIRALDAGDHSGVLFKLTDFGRSAPRMPKSVDDDWDFDVGDGRYSPLLEKLSKTFSMGLDIYALGLTLYQAAGGSMNRDYLTRFKEGKMEIDDLQHIIPELRSIVKEMLRPYSVDRPRITSLLRHCSRLKMD
nr:wee1 protein kinase 2 [Hymenolepis microstoma]